jgi:preprotein translocase subunit SecF
MDFPNIFKGDYRILAVIPLMLVLASIYFIPQVNLGVDFTGGTLISLTLDEKVDAEQLKDNLQSEGLDADVRVFDTAVGFKAEIEVSQNDNLIRAEELKEEFDEMLPEVSRLEVEANTNDSAIPEYEARRADIEQVANEMFALAEMDAPANVSGMNDLDRAFSQGYRSVYENYEESISAPINKHVNYNSISIQTVSPVLSTHFIESALSVVLLSVLLSILAVLFFFRNTMPRKSLAIGIVGAIVLYLLAAFVVMPALEPAVGGVAVVLIAAVGFMLVLRYQKGLIPSVAVVTGTFCDITIALGAMGLFGIPLTLPSFAALLMLVGYSLDTDILLTMRMLKRKGDPREKAHDSMKTGLTMSTTGVIAFSSLFALSTITHIPTYFEISAVALAGLIGDMFATWGINAVMLLWYVEKKEGS